MSDFIDTREGWRKVDGLGYDAYEGAGKITYWDGDGWSYWVREVPVPPLPTEPGTVIAIGDWRLARLEPYEPGLPGTWEMLPIPKAAQSSLVRAGAKAQCVYGDDWVSAEAEQHGGFEVLAEPREVTDWRYAEAAKITERRIAKAVVARVREVFNDTRDGRSLNETLTVVARDFGVTS